MPLFMMVDFSDGNTTGQISIWAGSNLTRNYQTDQHKATGASLKECLLKYAATLTDEKLPERDGQGRFTAKKNA